MDKATQLHEEAIRFAQQGDLENALSRFEAALELNPNEPVWHFNRGLACQRMRKLPDAISAYRTATNLAPDFFDAWSNLCAALKGVGNAKEAVAAGNCAVKLRPDAGGAHLNLGNALKAGGDWAEAEASYSRALVLEPNNTRTRLNLANTLREEGRLGEAITLLRESVVRSPKFAEAHRDLAFALLISGDLLEGWTENEWRWLTEDLIEHRRSYSRPMWQGDRIDGRTLFLYTEQGFGDAIQFARYVPLANKLGARIVLECQPGLVRLFQSLQGVSQVIPRGEPCPPFDFYLPLLSIPKAFRTQLDTIPAEVPYLKPPEMVSDEMSGSGDTRVNVGLAWAGNPSHLNDACRSLPFELIQNLLDIDSARFFSLQVGDRSQDLRQSRLGNKITDLSSRFDDFAATAAAIDKLDLVISVDTAVAHLSGALGKPIWLLLPYAPDWRWLLGRDTSPWYSTMRLFRQPTHRDWAAVIEHVTAELRVFVDSRMRSKPQT